MHRSPGIAVLAVAFAVVTLQPPPAEAQGFTTITSPLRVPLHWRSVDDDPTKSRKLGLYATIGGGTTPQLFEFDTGGDGLYARYATGAAGSPLLTAADVVVGLTSGMTQPGSGTLWPLPSGTSPPPTNGAFFGDFGMAPKQGQSGIDSLVAQLAYGAGMAAGFRVHAASENPWVQFGLAAGDLNVLPTTFALNAAIGSSAAGVPYYQPVVVTGSLDV